MSAEDDLWDKYCSFYEKDFQEQLEYNRDKLEEHLEKWSKTKTAKELCPDGFESIDDIPVTTYDDYPILQKFGRKMERLTDANPKPDGMLWRDYYKKMESKLKPMVEEWIPGEYGGVLKTTGSTGKAKWIVQGKRFFDNLQRGSIQAIVLSGSEEIGETSIRKGDTVLNMGVPVPYGVGYCQYCFKKEFNIFPSIEVTDNMQNMREKLNYILKNLKKGKKLHVVVAIAPTLYLFSKAVTEPAEIYRDYFNGMDPGIKKLVVGALFLKEKIWSRKETVAKDVLQTKGVGTGGQDVILYLDYLKEQFGKLPLNVYGATEVGYSMIGRPDNRMKLLPVLQMGYMEFLGEKNEVYKIDELKKGKVYKMIGTTFGSPLIRYDTGDLFRVVEIRDDGMPIFEFESKEFSILNIANYFIINERLVFRTLKRAGWRESSSWAVTKKIGKKQGLHFLMEKDWEHDEKEAERRIFSALKKENKNFENYIEDFEISKPSDIIEVEYLKNGAFKRYSLEKMKGDRPIGQYKAPKIILPKEKDIIEELRMV